MFELNALPSQLSSHLIQQALNAEPAVIGHFRLMGFPDSGIRPAIPCPRVAGTAVTLALPGADSALLHHVASQLRPGDMLMIDRLGDKTHACLGGGVAYALKQRGIAGVIVDGPVTDAQELRDHGVPIWARGLTAITTRTYGLGGAFNVPVSIGGAVVLPGDLVIADECGIVVLPPAQAGEAIGRALELAVAEKKGMPTIAAGRPLGEMSGASELIARHLKPRDQ